MASDWVFVCTECKSDQAWIDPYTNSWVQDGKTPPCKYCGGVVVYVENAADKEAVLRQIDRQRGISIRSENSDRE